jgi:hypothetical protein
MSKTDDILTMVDEEISLEKPILSDETRDAAQEGPEDKGDTVYYCFLFLGFCVLLPWSCVINSFDFMAVYVNSTFSLIPSRRCLIRLQLRPTHLLTTLSLYRHRYGS